MNLLNLSVWTAIQTCDNTKYKRNWLLKLRYSLIRNPWLMQIIVIVCTLYNRHTVCMRHNKNRPFHHCISFKCLFFRAHYFIVFSLFFFFFFWLESQYHLASPVQFKIISTTNDGNVSNRWCRWVSWDLITKRFRMCLLGTKKKIK